MMNGDVNTAIVEVNAIYAIDTTDQAALDTLSRLYFVKGNYFSTYQVIHRMKKVDGIQRNMLAESSMQLGKVEEATALYSDLIQTDTTDNLLNLKFKLATLHYTSENYEEALSLLSDIVAEDASLERQTTIKVDGGLQKVSLYAASHNFAGYIFLISGDYETARAHFNEAIRADENFTLPRNNLNELERLTAESIAE